MQKKVASNGSPSVSRKGNGGTFQIGVHGSIATLGAVEVGVGLAISDKEIGGYSMSGLGFGPKEDANMSIVFNWSNADSIQDLGGSGKAVSVGGGALGHISLQAELSDMVPGQKQIYSGGFALGLGAGAGAAGTVTQTDVFVWDSYED